MQSNQETLEALKSQKADLQEQVEIACLQAELEDRATHKAHVAESWEHRDRAAREHRLQESGRPLTIVDRTEFLRDGQGLSNFGNLADRRITNPRDRWHGDNYPFWRTETELRQIRGISRFIATTDEVGGSAIENLTNYVIGDGFQVAVEPKREHLKDDKARLLAHKVQRIIDLFIDENDWAGDLERELFQQSRRDGEFYIKLDSRGGPHVEATNIEPDFVTEPSDPRTLEDFLDMPGLDWKYGHAKAPNRPQKQFGVFCQWFGDDNDWDFAKPAQIVHAKINVDSAITRGLSDYYPVWQNLERAEKLLGNTLAGSAVQAAIAYIREHSTGQSGDDIENFISKRKDSTVNIPNQFGGRDVNVRKAFPGTVVDIKAGAKYHAGPLGSPRGQNYLDVVQGALRIVGIRWQMPEYMISGDASNSNFSSTLVSEAPFTKSSEAKQRFYVRQYTNLFWKVIAMASAWTGVPLGTIKRVLELKITPPEIAVRDKLEEHQIREGEHKAGVLSLKSWAEKAGHDFDEEQKRGASPQEQPGQMGDFRESASLWTGYP